VRFEAAWFLLALPPLLLWLWWLGRKSYAQLRVTARWSSLALRLIMLTCLVGALARPILVRTHDRQHVLFLIDASRSISEQNLDAALKNVDQLARQVVEQDRGHRISVIAFGRAPRLMLAEQTSWPGWSDRQRELIQHQIALPMLYSQRAAIGSDAATDEAEKTLEARIVEVEDFHEAVAGDGTDVGAALRLALNCGEVDAARTIYLLTDANFNRGQWESAMLAAKARGATVHAVALDIPIPPEVAAADLVLPSSVRVNQGFTADLHVASTVETAAKIVIYKDGYASAEMNATLKPGNNVIRIPGLFFRDKGFRSVDVVVRAERDTRVENNTVKSLVIVPGELRVLYVDAEESQQSYLKSALELEGMQVETRPAAGVPQGLDDLLDFDAFILCNVPADQLSVRQMQLIRTYVQDFGGGFIMLGGEQSFGLGGYYNTPVEEVLPVKMPIQKDLMRPSLALMLVIDKSGSMEGVKIQLAKRAALATAEAINPRDQIGVVGFDGESRVILELTSAGDRATVSAQIASLEAGGGTFLYPALEDARERLLTSNARRKHVIILSDGQTQGFGYGEMAQMMAGDGITVSAVGIGDGADMKLLEEVAMSGEGRAYFTNDFHSIPQIFTREALRASKSMLVERLVQPIAKDDDEALEELDIEDLPPLTGYVATTPRETAKLVLLSDSGDPILAKWRSGLGRTAAFTSDAKPRWAEDWIRWNDFAKFWTQLVRSVAGHQLAESISVEVTQQAQDDVVRLQADVRNAAGDFITDRPLELTLHDAQGGARKLAVSPEAPGLYAATVPQITYGRSQQLAWHVPDPQNKDQGMTVPFGFVYSFSPEFRTLGVSESVLERIKQEGLGDVMRVNDLSLKLGTSSGTEHIRLWPALLVVALLLVPLDILVRRVG
jgi:Mg-chelatase subunit ChlD